MQNEVLQPFTVCKSCELNEDGRGGEGRGWKGGETCQCGMEGIAERERDGCEGRMQGR